MANDKPTIVDIHCHTFNADDIPVEGFLKAVAESQRAVFRLLRRVFEAADQVGQWSAPGFAGEFEEIQNRIDVSPEALVAFEVETSLDEQADAILAFIEEEDPDLIVEAGVEVAAAEGEVGAFEPEAIPSPGDVKRLAKWALLFMKPRVRLVEILAETYPEVDLFTPMLVDLAPGVGDRAETTIRQQMLMQSEISKLSMLGRLRDAPNVRVHPFIGFDPRRPDGIALVREAVRLHGFVGVKLYPPMGFKPIGNSAAVDAALMELYEFCLAEEVPITAHGNPTIYADPAYQENSSPSNWRRLLETSGMAKLRVNFGHFGGTGTGEHKDWPHDFAAMADELPNVYADIGNHQLGRMDDYMDLLRRLFTDPSTKDMIDRVAFGTDWSMVASHKGFEDFLTRFRDGFKETFPEKQFPGALDGFMGGNALDFLGFSDAGNENAKRLAARYRALEVKTPPWLAV